MSNVLGSDNKLTSESLAVLIIDALIEARLLQKENFEEAIRIAILEIDIRKHAGDY